MHSCHASRPHIVQARARILAVLAVSAPIFSTFGARGALAQHERRYATLDAPRHVQSVVPRIGPAGTEVEVYTENLPPQAKIWVGVGAMRSGFEARAEGKQEMWGEVSATVTIPDYATWDRALVVIIFNGVFSPVAYSDPFHVTTEDGRVKRTGEIVDEGLECVTFRDNDEYLYALSGDGMENLKPGDQVVVEGTVAESGPCGDVDAITVVRWERVNGG